MLDQHRYDAGVSRISSHHERCAIILVFSISFGTGCQQYLRGLRVANGSGQAQRSFTVAVKDINLAHNIDDYFDDGRSGSVGNSSVEKRVSVLVLTRQGI